jgi:hypothetical protein
MELGECPYAVTRGYFAPPTSTLDLIASCITHLRPDLSVSQQAQTLDVVHTIAQHQIT